MATEQNPWLVDSGSFEIYLAWSETTLTVASGESALDVLLAAGVPIEPGCKSGACGMCATDFVEGDVIHKDVYLNPAERENTFCPCVSRAQTRIVLAL